MKKAQAAMEFLMTYGWAILVVLLVIASLSYFGVLNPSRFFSDRFTMGHTLYVNDFEIGVSDTNIATRVLLENKLPDPIEITAIEYGDIDCRAEGGDLFVCPSVIQPGRLVRVDIYCSKADAGMEDIQEGMRFRSNVKILYNKLGGFPGSEIGVIASKLGTQVYEPGDITGDGIVNLLDLTNFAIACSGGNPMYCDLNCDGVVDVSQGSEDLAVLGSLWGTCYQEWCK